MAIQGMNHVNVLTNNLEATCRFYIDVLGLAHGPRPAFNSKGAWLYAEGLPILHVAVRPMPKDPAGVLDHMAFSANDLNSTVAKLKANGIHYTLRQQLNSDVWQIFCEDPCGAKVELDFSLDEPAPAGE